MNKRQRKKAFRKKYQWPMKMKKSNRPILDINMITNRVRSIEVDIYEHGPAPFPITAIIPEIVIEKETE